MEGIALLAYLVTALYGLALLGVTLYCLMQLYLLWQARRELNTPPPMAGELPVITIQLPVFNERYVIARLIDCICALEYPQHRCEIQVLDDSTDDTSEIIRQKVEAYRAQGMQISHVRRLTRAGYKAGALAHGLESARGDLIAIFDADFLPESDFLLRCVPWLRNPRVGVVQARWEHLNETYSLLTRLQAFQLNVHFAVEQPGRQQAGMFLQFNGTAGVWRREAIIDAGGWHTDTLTEDLDLSYRAQLRGWQVRYLMHTGAPAELPVDIQSIKSQQFRWMKGGAETSRKLLWDVLRSSIPLGQKVFAMHHLLSSSVFLCVLAIAILSVPLLLLAPYVESAIRWYMIGLAGLPAIGITYYVANTRTSWRLLPAGMRIRRWLWTFPVFLSLSMGLSMHNSIAVMQGFFGKRSPFLRTPKFAIVHRADQLPSRRYLARHIPCSTWTEGLLALYFLMASIAAIVLQRYTFIIFHIVLMLGFGTICLYSIHHLVLAKHSHSQ